MALSFKLSGDILEVKEVIHSFFGSEVSYMYFDIKNWLVSRNTTGKVLNDTPVIAMSPSSIRWVKENYLPKVGIKEN